MSAKFQIGYPYATSPNERKSVVLLERQDKPGFIYINAANCVCRPMDRDEGPRILDGISNKGVIGNLKEFDEDKKSIVRDGKILAEGKSSQLAIVLAAHCFYDEDVESFPVLLFSAAVSCYSREMLKGAKIIPYAKENSSLTKSLVVKYEAACKIGAVAIVIPKRDARILARKLGESVHGVGKIKDLPKEKDKKPLIIGANAGSLPHLAKIIGIDKYIFTFSKTILKKYVGIIGALLGIIFLLFYFLYPKDEVHWNYIKSTDIWESEKYSFLRDLVSNSSPNYDNLNHLRLKNNYKKVQYFYIISSHYPKNQLPKSIYVPENLDALISTVVFEEKNNLTRNIYNSPSIKKKLNLKLKTNIKNVRLLVLIYPFSDRSEKFISEFLQPKHGKKLKNIGSLLTIKFVNE